MWALLFLFLTLWLFGAAVGADHMSHWINERNGGSIEDGWIANKFGNNATKWLRAGFGVAVTYGALTHPETWALWATGGALLLLAYYTAGVAWRNGLIATGEGHLEREYEETWLKQWIWIIYAWR